MNFFALCDNHMRFGMLLGLLDLITKPMIRFCNMQFGNKTKLRGPY